MWISAAFLLFALAVNGDKSEDSFSIGRRCPTGWEKFGTKCFKFFSDLKPWAAAEKQCVDLGGNLASIHNQLTHNFLKTFLKKYANKIPRTWIGAHDATKDYVWFWSDGSKFEYSDWHTGEPNGKINENCVEMGYGAEQRWNDAHCNTLLSFICSKTARIDF
ncbi:galactose-specific lectin nattectin-like [Sinocyclocheilus rhinocerous]|uniref:Galactose-specific lectin nattectin-like n=1 Tax=Sinocyclocheilus rhinocerous TaxID=307959 RepID=A0A673HGY6_9TELE|nr:PREDICTED: galactose-specific lectin nattectin-like [Sinocyclocheilus rhinocerous]XP_016375364.1 PREDICTED: galactose-specific lectin nattectin-like [Sinocyclocheilus rhinocerous]